VPQKETIRYFLNYLKTHLEATLIEVTIANILGPFVSPALTRLYLMSSPAFEGLVPGSDGLCQLYANVFQLLGCSLFAPFAVGQLLQYFFPNQTAWALSRVPSLPYEID